MDIDQYKKAHRIAWFSFALIVIPRALNILVLASVSASDREPNLDILFLIVSCIGVAGMIYSCVLALRTKARTLAWLLLLLPLNLLGVVAIFMLSNAEKGTKPSS
jgi:hypothetical protein